jgi:hypothetical protein
VIPVFKYAHNLLWGLITIISNGKEISSSMERKKENMGANFTLLVHYFLSHVQYKTRVNSFHLCCFCISSYARYEFDVLNLTYYNLLGVQSSNDHPCLRTSPSPPPPLLWWASSNIYHIQHRVFMNSLSPVPTHKHEKSNNTNWETM